jgi:DMSO/TMAO reductase YedYZ molybdopterin-dependent catalytic subunit
MITRALQTILFLLLLLCTAIGFGQTGTAAPTNTVVLTVDGEAGHPLKLTADDLAKLARRSLRAKGHDGKEALFEGFELGDVLKLAGVKFGEQLRGKELALFLVVEAADGYRCVFALPELDHAFTDRIIIVADRRDGKPLSEKEGPLRIIVPDEKREARWVRQVVRFTINRAEEQLKALTLIMLVTETSPDCLKRSSTIKSTDESTES